MGAVQVCQGDSFVRGGKYFAWSCYEIAVWELRFTAATIIWGILKRSFMNRLFIRGFLFIIQSAIVCGGAIMVHGSDKKAEEKAELKLATFGSGCFWCTQAIFQRLNGVEKVVAGYSGGHVDSPTYEQACTGATGHAESIQIAYNPAKVSFDTLLEVFWKMHDPTTKDRQGNDAGPQYRSVIFYHDAEQKKLAEMYKSKLEAEHIWNRPIVTEIVPFTKFWQAESYHQNYYDKNPTKSYCNIVITPKIEKFRKVFQDRMKNPH
jgi:peptide-methionine (S)-S-oxide reductase